MKKGRIKANNNVFYKQTSYISKLVTKTPKSKYYYYYTTTTLHNDTYSTVINS
jgi:hypothetical protein